MTTPATNHSGTSGIYSAAIALLPACLIGWFAFVSLHNAPDLQPRPIRLPLESAYSPYMDDFLVFYAAGRMATEEPEKIYDPLRARHYQAEIAGQVEHTASILPFFNSPPTVMVLAAVALLPLNGAALAWTGAGLLGAVVASSAALRKRITDTDPWLLLAWLTAVMASLPFYEALFHGQISFFLLAASAFVWLGIFKESRPGIGTLGLCILAAKPNLLAGPVIYLLATGQWRTLLPFLAVQAVATAAAMLLFDASLPLRHVELLLDAGGWDEVNGIATYFMFGWTGLLRGMLEFASHDTRSVIGTVLSLITLGAAAAVWRQAGRLSAEERFMSVIAVSLLVSPHSYAQDLLLLALPFALLATGPRHRAQWAAVALTFWFAMYFHFTVLEYTHIGVASLSLVLLTAGLIFRVAREIRTPITSRSD